MRTCEKIARLKKGNPVVWFAKVDRPVPAIKEFEMMLSPVEAARAHRFHSLWHRERYIFQHGVLRILLADYLGCELRQVDIRTTADGKTYLESLEDGSSLQFSVSHSGSQVAFAICRNSKIGVDIEEIRQIPEMEGIIEQHFTSREKYEIFSCSGEQRLMLFYRFWTRKEAVLKAQGEGLLRSLDCVDVATSADAHGPWKVLVTGDLTTEEFWVSDTEGPAGFAAAVAAASPFIAISTRLVGEQIINRACQVQV